MLRWVMEGGSIGQRSEKKQVDRQQVKKVS